MLLRVIFLTMAIAVLGETLLHAAATLALAAFHRQGAAVARIAFVDAAQLAQGAIATALASGATPPATIPAPTPFCALSNGATCAMIARTTIALTTPAPAPCPSDDCGAYLQGNDAIEEGRLAVAIDAVVTNAVGDTIAVRSGDVIFRTLRIAPYAIPAGSLDATLDDFPGSVGDAGGMAPFSSSSGTLIDVVYRNAVNGAAIPANVWTGLAPSAAEARAWTP